jgi:hypothetical protein
MKCSEQLERSISSSGLWWADDDDDDEIFYYKIYTPLKSESLECTELKVHSDDRSCLVWTAYRAIIQYFKPTLNEVAVKNDRDYQVIYKGDLGTGEDELGDWPLWEILTSLN